MRLLIPSETGIIGDIPVLVAMVAAGLDESLSPRGAIRQALEIDPFSFGEGRAMVRRIHQFLDLADRAESDRELALMVSRAVQGINPHRSIERRFKENGSYPRAAADLLRWRSISGRVRPLCGALHEHNQARTASSKYYQSRRGNK